MGNPSLRSAIDDPPLGIRHCCLCRSCEELVLRHGVLKSLCPILGSHREPETGCARFSFDPQALGDEGAE